MPPASAAPRGESSSMPIELALLAEQALSIELLQGGTCRLHMKDGRSLDLRLDGRAVAHLRDRLTSPPVAQPTDGAEVRAETVERTRSDVEVAETGSLADPTDIGERPAVSGPDGNAFVATKLGIGYDPGFIGPAIDHLGGLPGGRFEFRSGPERRSSAVVSGRVGAAIDHLGSLDSEASAGPGPNPVPFVWPVVWARHRIPEPIVDRQDADESALEPSNLRDALSEDGSIRGALFAVAPSGAVAGLRLVVQPTLGAVALAENGTFAYRPDRHASGEDTFSFAYIDPRTGEVRTGTVVLAVAPVADTPIVAVGAESFQVGEDEPVEIAGLAARLADRDGSESLAVRISGVPVGAGFLDLSGRPVGHEVGGGIWSFAPDELAGLRFVPPPHANGRYTMRLEARATEGANGEEAEADLTFTVMVDPRADAPAIGGETSFGNEDEPIAFGQDIVVTPADADGSERLSEVAILGLPTGARFAWTTAAGSAVVQTDGGVVATGTEAAIRATLSTFALVPVRDSDTDVPVVVTATTIESDGSRASTTATHLVRVLAVADAPIVAGGGAGSEDTAVPVPITVVLRDLDRSETLAFVDVSGVPAGASLRWDGTLTGTVSAVGDGAWRFGGEPGEIEALLGSLVFTPPTDGHGTFVLSVVARSTESHPSEPGDVAVPFAETRASVRVSVAAVADAPLVPNGTTLGREDTSVLFGANVAYALADADGSETIVAVVLSGFPTGVVPTYAAAGGATVTVANSVYTVTGQADAIRATLDTFAVAPAPDTDADLAVDIRVTSRDADGSEASTAVTHAIVVSAVPDAPSATAGAGTFRTDEDVPVALAGLGAALTDLDGSEALALRIEGMPVGALLHDGQGAPVGTDLGGGLWSVPAAALAGGLVFVPPPDADGTYDLVLRATSTETSNGLSADTTVPFRIVVEAVADDPVVTDSASTGFEDSSIIFGRNIAFATADVDGSERVSAVALSGFPAGTVVSYATSPGAVVSIAGGVYTITGSEAAIRATLDGFGLTPSANSDADFVLTVAVTTTDGTVDATRTALHGIVVTAVADAPAVPSGTSAGAEDSPIPFGVDITIAIVDGDGSEQLTQLRIAGVPAGAILAWNTSLGGQVTGLGGGAFAIDGTEAEIRALAASLTIRPPADSDEDIVLALRATVADHDGSTAFTDATHAVVVSAVPDAPSATAGAGTFRTDEDVPVALAGLGAALTDLDGSEALDLRIEGVPIGALLRDGQGALVGTDLGGGLWSVPAAALAGGLVFVPPPDADGTYDLVLRATSTETSNGLSADTTVPFRIVVEAVADAPSVASGTTSGDEDASIAFGSRVAYALADTDGSERISRVELSAFPAGATVAYAETGGGSVALVGGVYAITGSAAGIRSTLNTFAVRPPADSDADFAVTVKVTSTDTGGVSATTTGSHAIVVAAVADQPNVPNRSTAGNEDASILFGPNVLYGLADTDGSEEIASVVLSGFPAGVTASYSAAGSASVVQGTGLGGTTTFTITGPQADIRATLDTFAVRGLHDSDADFVLGITVTASDTGGVVASRSGTHTIVVAAVADTPSVGAPDAPYAADEDLPVALAGLAGALADIDGSETLGFRIEGVPNGAGFTNGAGDPVGTDLGGGAWKFAPAQIGGLRFVPPTNASGSYAMSLTAVATESSNASVASASKAFTVVVEAQADAPIAPAGNTAGTEDQPVAFGARVAYSLADADGSETISQIVLSGFPPLAAVAYTPGTATVAVSGTSYVITGSAAAIRSALDSFTVVPPPNSDAAFTIGVSITTTDADGSTATAGTTHAVTLAAAADPPVVPAGSTTGAEDTTIAFGANVAYALVDTDGSERITKVTLSSFPTGSNVTYTAAGGGTVSLASGIYTIQGTPTGIRATLDTFTVRPPVNSDADFAITVKVTSTDTGGVTATTTGSHAIVVEAVADAPSVPSGSTSGNEDAAIAFGSRVAYALADADGSEQISRVELSAFPAGAAVAYAETGGGSVALAGGVYAITGSAAGIRATLNTFAVRPPTDSDADFAVTVKVTATDTGGVSATTTASHAIVVAAVPDTPSVAAAGPYQGSEDAPIALPGLAGALADVDGSEILSFRITGVPAGSSFDRGTDLGGGVWQFSAADLDAGLAFTPVAQSSGSVAMTLVAVTTETSNGLTAQASRPFTVDLAPVLDSVTVASGSGTVNEDATLALGPALGISLADRDGSQSLSVTIQGVPAGAVVGAGVTVAGVAVVNDGNGTITISGSHGGNVLSVVNSLTLRPHANRDGDFDLSISVVTAEGGASQTATGVLHVGVRAVADAPTVTGAGAGNEDTAIAVPVTVALADADGSETLDWVTVSGVPTGATLGWDHAYDANVSNTAAGTYRVVGTAAEIGAVLGSLTLVPPTNSGSNVVLTIVAQSRETNPAEAGDVAVATATRTRTVVVDVVPVADAPSLGVPGTLATEEDTPVPLSGLAAALVDVDGSETLTLTLSGVPLGANFGGKGVDLGGGSGVHTWRFTAAEVAAGLTFVPPADASGTYTFGATAIATESENGSRVETIGSFQVTVDTEADAPLVGSRSNGSEDTTINFGRDVRVGLADIDGSEQIVEVTLSGFDADAAPTYAASGSATVTVSGGVHTISGSAADIRATLDSFSVRIGPSHSDRNLAITVTATTRDADGSNALASGTHAVIVRAAADAPTLTVGATATGSEDDLVPLAISAGLVDADGSELLSVRITGVPDGGAIVGNTFSGGAITALGGGSFLVSAPDEATLNTLLGTLKLRPPANFAGVATLGVTAIATEGANGDEVAVKTASTSSAVVTVTVSAVADPPTMRLVDALGSEDAAIPLSIQIYPADADGSERITLVRISGVPAGAIFLDTTSAPVGTDLGGGVWSFDPAAMAGLRIVPPHDSNADMALTVAAYSTESAPGLPGDGDTAYATAVLRVEVVGVADSPVATIPVVAGTEDQPIALGAAIQAHLSDADGSETLSYVLTGLPAGIVPSAGTYIGGAWQVSAAEMPGLTLRAPAEFSGDYVATFAPSLSVRIVSQENDGNQTSVTVPVRITLAPVVDGFAGWAPGVQVAEDQDVPLAGLVGGIVLPDADGSESIISYTIDLRSIVADARIGALVPDAAAFVRDFVRGTFADNGDGTITVAAADVASVRLLAGAFRDSNVDFVLPVTARVAEVGGGTLDIAGTFSVNLVGDADTPTALAHDVAAAAGTLVALAGFGGECGDTDASLGRTPSEEVYYVVSGLHAGGLRIGFYDGGGNIAGFDNGDGTWLLRPSDLADLHIGGPAGSDGTAQLTWTTVATENDGDRSSASVAFQVTLTSAPGNGAPNPHPLPPIIDVGTMTTNEDQSFALDVSVRADPADVTSPTLTLIVTGLPAGAAVTGASYNLGNGQWVLPATALAAGNIRVTPPPDFSGTLVVQLRAVATDEDLETASSTATASIAVTPVADGPAISAADVSGTEDTPIALSIALLPRDRDAASPEVLHDTVLLTVPAGTILSAGTDLGGGRWSLDRSDLSGLTMLAPANFSGRLAVNVEATTEEPGSGAARTGSATFHADVAAAPDAPTVSVADAVGTEDHAIALSGLAVALVDTDGSELLSAKLSGVPLGALLSAGSNNGDGSWTIPVGSLGGLSITPPQNYSGVMTLTLTGYVLETSTGQTAQTSRDFQVTVAPEADAVVVDVRNVATDEDTAVLLPIDVTMWDATGALAGEGPPETLEITFAGLPIGSVLTAGSGGTLTELGGGQWQFGGTAAEAGTLNFTPPANFSGTFTVTTSAISIDGGDVLAAPVAGSFRLTVTPVADAPALVAIDATGPAGSFVALHVATGSTDSDGSESLALTIAGVPSGVLLNHGTDLGGGLWSLTRGDLLGLGLTLPAGAVDATLHVTATSRETGNGAAASSTADLFLAVATPNVLAGTSGDDVIAATADVDLLTGGPGADRFVWTPGTLGTRPDTLADFQATEGDRIDLSALLSNHQAGIDDLSRFIDLVDTGDATAIRIDPTGGGHFDGAIVTLENVANLTLDQMRAGGQVVI